VVAVSSKRNGRIIASFSFSSSLPNKWIVEKLAQSLFAETAGSVLLLRMVSANDSLGDRRALDNIIDGDFHLRDNLPKANGSVARLSLKITGSARDFVCFAGEIQGCLEWA